MSKALKVVRRMLNGALVSTFERWRDQIIKEKQMKSKALKVVQRIMIGTLVQVFELWRDNTTEQKQMMKKARKVVHRIMNTTLVQVFELWRDKASCVGKGLLNNLFSNKLDEGKRPVDLPICNSDC